VIDRRGGGLEFRPRGFQTVALWVRKGHFEYESVVGVCTTVVTRRGDFQRRVTPSRIGFARVLYLCRKPAAFLLLAIKCSLARSTGPRARVILFLVGPDRLLIFSGTGRTAARSIMDC
jgi:hypothetical protein